MGIHYTFILKVMMRKCRCFAVVTDVLAHTLLLKLIVVQRSDAQHWRNGLLGMVKEMIFLLSVGFELKRTQICSLDNSHSCPLEADWLS